MIGDTGYTIEKKSLTMMPLSEVFSSPENQNCLNIITFGNK